MDKPKEKVIEKIEEKCWFIETKKQYSDEINRFGKEIFNKDLIINKLQKENIEKEQKIKKAIGELNICLVTLELGNNLVKELQKENTDLMKAYTQISKECRFLRRENSIIKRNLRLIGNLTESINSANWKIARLISDKIKQSKK